ncbi:MULTISPECIES: hypothetical protein [unclassified Streptomyces]|uniref:hypothetical protein n=1 Tax=unclassified Streptomyces TaxID=2593676 RepID=UPI0029BC9C3C|nr:MULTISPECIES: hypothetical protein [unclassified Streptomyces]MDX3766445.1 hypothetical protein [Streptomyces sp. AK08-01B]MDX3816298.1 hypothetical protein [Streptomyces sp. AK08-01A]
MGTRAVVARPTPQGFTGRIFLNDGTPGTAVAVLRGFVLNVQEGDVEAAARVLIDDHPGGWIDVPDPDCRGRCLCHDAPPINGPASTEPTTEQTASEAEYVYVLHPERLAVLAPGGDGWEEIGSTPWWSD